MSIFSQGGAVDAAPNSADVHEMLRQVAAETAARKAARDGGPVAAAMGAAAAEEDAQDTFMSRMQNALQKPLSADDLPRGVRLDYVLREKGKTTHDFAFAASDVIRRFETADKDAAEAEKAAGGAKSTAAAVATAEAAVAAGTKDAPARLEAARAAAAAAAEAQAAGAATAAASMAAARAGLEPPLEEGALRGRALHAFQCQEANFALFKSTQEKMAQCQKWFEDYQSRLVFAVTSFVDKEGSDECSRHRSEIGGALLRAEADGPNPEEVARILAASADQMQERFDRAVMAHLAKMVKEWRAREAEYRGLEAVLAALNRIRPLRVLGRIHAEACAEGGDASDGAASDGE